MDMVRSHAAHKKEQIQAVNLNAQDEDEQGIL